MSKTLQVPNKSCYMGWASGLRMCHPLASDQYVLLFFKPWKKCKFQKAKIKAAYKTCKKGSNYCNLYLCVKLNSSVTQQCQRTVYILLSILKLVNKYWHKKTFRAYVLILYRDIICWSSLFLFSYDCLVSWKGFWSFLGLIGTIIHTVFIPLKMWWVTQIYKQDPISKLFPLLFNFLSQKCEINTSHPACPIHCPRFTGYSKGLFTSNFLQLYF